MENVHDLRYIMALLQCSPWSNKTIKQLLTDYPDPEEAFHRATFDDKEHALDEADKELAFIRQHEVQTYFYKESTYPYRLAECPDAPILLYAKGNMDFNKGRIVSIVGTRMPTDRGKELCRRFVLDLCDKVSDLTVVSGLAYGVDVTAHRAAMEAEAQTIIIPGHGLDRIYPSVHRADAVRALKKGGILTEYPSGTEPYATNFVARNRIIAGLADAVVVVESKQKGGSLITARMAMDYNRDVFTFPGRCDDATSSGCNQLIKLHQAQLIESADDLVQMMQWPLSSPKAIQTEMVQLDHDLSPSQQTLLQILRESGDGIHVNLLVMQTGQPYHDVCADLMLMELDDIVKSLPGGMWIARR